MKDLARVPSSMPRSGIRLIMELSAEIQGVLHLEVGQPDFETPRHISDAAHKALLEGYTRYTHNAGLMSLRRAIADRMNKAYRVGVDTQSVTVAVGGIGGLSSAMFAIVDPGDEVLIPDPGWPNYESIVMLCGAKVVRYPLRPENDFMPDPVELESLITPSTKVLLVNSPSNPCGSVFTPEVVRDIKALVDKHGIFLLSDEVYDELVYEGAHETFACGDEGSRTVSVFSFSKTYAMTGWRVGYCISSPDVMRQIAKLQEGFVSCAPAVSQKAAEAALTGPRDAVTLMREAYRRRRDRAVDILRQAGRLVTVPHGAFYILADISSTGLASNEFSKRLLVERKVAVAPGETFGEVASQCVRLSLATKEEDLILGASMLCEFAASLS